MEKRYKDIFELEINNYKQANKRYKDIRRIAKDFYIEFYNNYLTTEKISEHYEIPDELGKQLIDFGRIIFNERSK